MRPAGVLCLSYSGAEQITEASICSDLSSASFMASLYTSKASSRIETRIGADKRTLADTDYRDLCHVLLLVWGLDASVILEGSELYHTAASEINKPACSDVITELLKE